MRIPVRGERHGRAKLTLWDICAIRALKGDVSVRRIARAFSVSRAQVRRIQSGELWRI